MFLRCNNCCKGREHAVAGFIGDFAVLPCEVDLPSCGRVYFITWTKNVSNDWRREYLYSEGMAQAMGDFAEPERVAFSLSNHSAQLRLNGLTVGDEGTYKCDVTYVQGKCPSLSFTKLYTLITPLQPEMEVEGRRVDNGTTVGPYMEGSTFVLECRSSGGRPAPEVTWWNGSKPLTVKTTVIPEGNGTYFVTSTVRFVLSRWDLGAKIECRVRSNATLRPFTKWIKLDIHVRPLALSVRGPLIPVVAGEMVSLTCTVEGARPAANITWYNRSEMIKPQPVTNKDLMSDGTYRSTSSVVLVASRHDHKGEFFCKGTNEVLKRRMEAPLLQATTLEVLYPPAVMILPGGAVTVHESTIANLTCSFNANPPDVTEIVWYKDGVILHRDVEQRSGRKHALVPTLLMNNISRNDSGSYTCHVRNAFGRGNSTNAVFLDVLYAQSVQLKMSSSVVSETSSRTVSLKCTAVDGNPRNFTAVRWYKNDNLINETLQPVLHLRQVTRAYSGNYSCDGLNTAGWSRRSSIAELNVHYLPGVSNIRQREDLAIKGRPVTLECRVQDVGNPPVTLYRWERSGMLLNATGSSFFTEPVTVRTQGNYSCSAVNDIGVGASHPFLLKAVAAPSFVQKLPETGGVLRNATAVYLSCQVECDPLCEIEWLRNNESLRDSIIFESKTSLHKANAKKNIFSSVSSVLSWNMTLLPAMSFDHNTFTCSSTENEIGPGVSSTLLFRTEYPPENIHTSTTRLEVIEGGTPGDVICSASAHPLGDYVWKTRDREVARGPVLTFNSSVSRSMAGNYTCLVTNRHGSARATVAVVILHRPDCDMWKDYSDEGSVILSCRAIARPPVFNFTWLRNNVTIYSEEDADQGQDESVIALSGSNPKLYGRYYCIATNEIGSSDPCYLELTQLPSPAGWVQLLLQEENLLIVAGVAGGVGILLVTIVITAVAVVLKRRFQANNKEDLEERRHPIERDRAADTTPLGASPLLSCRRQDGSPLLRKKRAGQYGRAVYEL